MGKKHKALNGPVKAYTAAELIPLMRGLKKSEILRTIILNEKEYLAIDYDRSLRGFWYSTVKPTLDKLGLLTETDATEAGLTRWDAELSRYVANLVRAGDVTYEALRIVDTSRQRQTPAINYDCPGLDTYGYPVTTALYSHVIISTEKDTVYSIISDIATFFGCSCISGKGQNPLAAMEDLLRNMDASAVDPHAPITILTMTDYDPAGYYIADTFRKQANDLKKNLGIARQVRIHRIGIRPDQLTPDEVRQNWYTPKPANLAAWMKKTGGIDGHPKGLELDALEPARVRRIFVDALREYVDVGKYSELIRKAYLKKITLDCMKDKIDDIFTAVSRDLLDSVTLKDVDLLEVAAHGYRYMPVDQLCDTSQAAAIKRQVLSHFA